MINTKVIYMNLPEAVKGFVVQCFDNGDCYTIVLNAKHSFDQNRKTYFHELEHIKYDDFRSMLSADQIESLRH